MHFLSVQFVLHIPPSNKIFKSKNNVNLFMAVVIQIVVFGLCHRVVWCVYGSVLVRHSATSFRVAVRRITTRSNYTGWSTAACHITILVCKSISRLCATLYMDVTGNVVTQTYPSHFDPADGGSIFLRNGGTRIQHCMVSQNHKSAL